jgi:hypothetical protein
MKHIVKVSVMVMILGFASMVNAHGGHKSINGQEAIMITNKTIQQMTFKDLGFEVGQLGNQWKNVTNDKVDVLNIIEGHYIVKASLSDTDNIYFQISPNGQVVDVKSKNDF